MNLTVTPNNYNNYNHYNNKQAQFRQNRPTFSGVNSRTAEEVIQEATTSTSKFFKPLYDAYDRFTDFIADKFTSRVVNWRPLLYLAEKFKDSDNLFKHCMTVGSVITSGLYMQRTITNKDMDKDRRNTLAVNQGLTLIASTIGAYALDSSVSGWWENVTARFAGHLLDDDKFYSNFLKEKEATKAENKILKANGADLKPMPKVTKLVEKHANYKALGEDEAVSLLKKVKGMSPLKSIIVFSFIYRYFVPVAVTKPANKLCDMYLKNKKEKQQDSKKA